MGERERIIDGLAATFDSVVELCERLSDSDWDRPTGCPGWTIKDQVSHLIGTERMVAGRPPAPSQEPYGEHVRNDIAKFNEAEVLARKATPGAEVLKEFRALADERIAALRTMSDDDFSKDSMTPVGPGTYEDFMGIRLFDSWVHEQDIRRALGTPGHLDGPAVDVALEHMLPSLGRTVGKKAGAPEGATVVIELTGPISRRVGVGVQEGRASFLPEPPTDPTASISLDGLTFVALACGRSDADASAVELGGDEDLARKVADNLAFTF
jgi:uncharacterized protein (TIGR03083 family)